MVPSLFMGSKYWYFKLWTLLIYQDIQTKQSHDLVRLGLTLGSKLEKSRSYQWWCSKLFPNRVCGLKTLQDLSCCYLLAAGSHWNPWNNKLNLLVPLPEAQQSYFCLRVTTRAANSIWIWYWVRQELSEEPRLDTAYKSGPRKCHRDNATHARHRRTRG